MLMLRFTFFISLIISLSVESFAQLSLVSEKLYCQEGVELYQDFRYDEAYHKYLNCARELSSSDTLGYHVNLLNAGISALEAADYLKAEKLFLTCKTYFSQ